MTIRCWFIASPMLGAIVLAASLTPLLDTVEAAEGSSGPRESVWPVPHWPRAEPAEVEMDEAKLARARDYALTGGGSGYITRHGRLAGRRVRQCGRQIVGTIVWRVWRRWRVRRPTG